jgi:sortase A
VSPDWALQTMAKITDPAVTKPPRGPLDVAPARHRDTFFRVPRNIREGNEITLETLSGLYRYRVDSTKVDPGEMRVLDNSDNAVLTLVTCYPFTFVGSAPKRFIVRAHKLSATTTGPTSVPDLARGMR